MPFMCRQRRNRPMKRKALSAQATQKKKGKGKKKVTSLTPGTGSTVRAAWFPT